VELISPPPPGAAFAVDGVQLNTFTLVWRGPFAGSGGGAAISLSALQGFSSDRPYGGTTPLGEGEGFTLGDPGSYLHPLEAHGFDPGAPDLENQVGSMYEIVSLQDEELAPATFARSAQSEVTVDGTIEQLRTVPGPLLSTVEISGAITAAAVYSPLMMDLVTLLSAAAREGEGVAWVLNLRNKANSQYSDYVFDSFARFKGLFLAAGADGLVELTGDTDLGDPIVASVLLGKTDFDSEFLKRVPKLYLGASLNGEMHVAVHTDDGRVRIYKGDTTAGLMRTRFVGIGRGLLSRYWQIELFNPLGEDFTLDSTELTPSEVVRRRR